MPKIPEWVQSALFDANVIEVTLSIGLINSPEHIQLQVETRDPIGGQLLDLWSAPHALIADLPTVLAEAVKVIGRHIQSNLALSVEQDAAMMEISDAAPPCN